MYNFFIFFIVVFSMACSNKDADSIDKSFADSARNTNVECIGQPNNYTLSVTIESPDTGCDQYANWWEVISPSGQLIYRRILGHSHVNEQPFTRSGGVVNVGPMDTIIVRAHMNNLEYGTQVFKGIVLNDGLAVDSLSSDFAIELETEDPLPGDCPF